MNDFAPQPQGNDLDQAFGDFFRRVSLFSRGDGLRVIWAYSRYLESRDFAFPADIEVAQEFRQLEFPQIWISDWQLETLAREILTFSRPDKGLTKRSIRKWQNLSSLVNSLKRLEDEIYGEYGGQGNVLIEMGRIANRQFIWQSEKPNAVSICRYFQIFNTEDLNEICVDRLGMTVKQVYQCSVALLGHFWSSPVLDFPIKSEFEALPAELFDRLVSWCGLDADNLKDILKNERCTDDRFAYAYSSIRQYPLTIFSSGTRIKILCPLPTLLFWRFTNGLYYDLVNDKRFSNRFGASFQNYIGDVLSRISTSNLTIIPELPYGTRKNRKQSVDWIVSDGEAAVFLECKSKRLSWEAKAALTDILPLERDIESLASSVVQVYKTMGDYLEDQYPHFRYRTGLQLYPLVVTLENWRLFGPSLVSILDGFVRERLEAKGLPLEWLDRYPYAIMAADGAESCFQLIENFGISEFLGPKLTNEDFSTWEWKGYSRERYPNFEYRSLFNEEYESIFSGLSDSDM